MVQLFNIILYEPLFNLLVFLFNIVQDVGVAIIILTFIIKVALYPLTRKTLKAQRDMQELQPKIKELQDRYRNDKTRLGQETLKLYQEHGVNPLGGCVPLLIQLPLLIALFQVFRTGFDASILETTLYAFVDNPGALNPWFLGIVDLSTQSFLLALLAGAAQFFHTRMMTSRQSMPSSGRSDMGQMMQKQMTVMMPILTVIISLSLPAALPFYWLANTLFSIAEHYIYIPPSMAGFHIGEGKKLS